MSKILIVILFAILGCTQATRENLSSMAEYGFESKNYIRWSEQQEVGCFAALFHAYVDNNDLSTNEVSFINGIGGIEGLEQGNDGHSSEVIGAVSFAGGIYDYNNLNLITSNDVPIFAIHGTADIEVPYTSSGNNPVTYGSKPITEKVSSVGLASELFTIENGYHAAPTQKSDNYILELMYFLRDIIQ